MPTIEDAIALALQVHRGQVDRAGAPYILHPLRVMSRFYSETERIVAVLHDVVEDTDWTLERLADQFPPKVLEIVEVLTEKKHDRNGAKRPWHVRKAEKLEKISASDVDARAVWLADKRHNLETMAFDHIDDPDFWSRFNAPKEALLKSYRDGIEAARHGDPRLEHLADECLEILAQLEES